MDKIRFGPAGNSDSFYAEGHDSTMEMPAWIAGKGLNAFEYSFGRGVRLKEETARAIGAEAARYGIQMSVHMPYFINLAAEEPEKKEKNIGYFMDSLRIAKELGAVRAVFHPGAASNGDREEIRRRAEDFFREIIRVIDAAGYGDIRLCPETMGKVKQLGRLHEVIGLCRVDERVLPTIDFGHMHCIEQIERKEDYARILDALENGIGKERTRIFHSHFSRIEFTAGGEKMHHTFADTQYGPEFSPLAELVAERDLHPTFICESKGTMAEDAVQMMEMYRNAQQMQ